MKAAPNSKFTVLSVDDSESDSELIAVIIKRIGDNRLLQALSCEEANRLLEKVTPDLLLLDISMHGTHGLDYLDEIRRNKKFDKMPVCIYTNSSSIEHIDAAFAKKANRYIVKPTTLAGTMEVLKRIIECDWSDEFYCTRGKFVMKPFTEPS